MSRIVSHYGVHWDENGVAHLMQGKGSTNAKGLKIRPPFEVQLPNGKRHCNHLVSLAAPLPNDTQTEFFDRLMDDALVRAALPIPKPDAGVYFVENPPESDVSAYFALLSRMSAPIHSVVMPIGTLTPQAILSELQTTNVQPFFVTDLDPSHTETFRQLAAAATYLPRTIIFSGSSDVIVPNSVRKLKSPLLANRYGSFNDLIIVPWETFGSMALRKHMRRETLRFAKEAI